MKLAVFSHKPCWTSAASPSGYATDGGFPIQMRAISELFEETAVVVPVTRSGARPGEAPLTGHNMRIAPLAPLAGQDFSRKVRVPLWLLRNGRIILREALRADAVHAPVPGDIGTLGMLCAFLLRKPLFVRHCGNWLAPRTAAERFLKWFMQRFAGKRNVMLATGGADESPSRWNANVRWIFSTSLSMKDLDDQTGDGQTGGPRLVIACRQERLKGTGTAIRSLPLILREFPQATLDVAGDGGALEPFKELARSLQIADRVVFHGKIGQREVVQLFRKSTLFCYPTQASEGFPKVVLEALACGLPVVTTRVSVLPKLLASGCGILIDEATPEAVAAAVLACLEPDRYPAMSRSARETARQYSLENWRETIGNYLRAAWGPLVPNASR